MLKQREATRIGRAINPEPIMPAENSTGPAAPNVPKASEAMRVVMLDASETCRWEAATMAEMEIMQATKVPAWDSVTWAWARPSGSPRLELVCQTTTLGVKS